MFQRHSKSFNCYCGCILNYAIFRDGTFVGPASKAFFCDDLTGQNYLCYLLPTKLQLCMVKLDFSNNANFIFGVFTSMSAKDAVPVPVSCDC